MSESTSTFSDVASAFGVPVLLAAFVFQPAVAALDAHQRTNVWLLAMLALLILTVSFLERVPRWLSVALAGVACGGFAVGWSQIVAVDRIAEVANQRRCLLIQNDMLSSQPRRTDGPNLFQALGCRPQGEGSVYAPPMSPDGRKTR